MISITAARVGQRAWDTAGPLPVKKYIINLNGELLGTAEKGLIAPDPWNLLG